MMGLVPLVMLLTLSNVPLSHNEVVSLLPNDPMVEDGDELILNCTLNCSSCNPFFTYGNAIPLSPDVQNLTGNFLQLRMKVDMNLNDVTFTCFNNVTNMSQTLTVVEAPNNVSDWSALVKNFETLNVTWTLNNDPKTVSVSTRWSPDYGGNRNPCSLSSNLFCFLNASTFNYSPEYYLTINVTNKLNNSAISTISIVTQKYVKPNPVKSLLTTVLNSTHINLSWIYSKFLDADFVIECIYGNYNYTKITSLNEVSFGDLKPYTNYTCCVYVYLNRSIYVSEKRCLAAKTEQDKPNEGPNILGYSMDTCRNERRNVYMYVKAPDEENRNGVLNGCDIRTLSTTGRILTNNSCSPSSSTIKTTIRCYESNVISITVSTTGGSSPPATLSVPKYNESASKFQIKPGLLLVKDRVVLYCTSCENWTAYWCKGSSFNCTSPLHGQTVKDSDWSVVPVNRTQVEDVLIGFSNSPWKTSEIVWTHCFLDLTKDKVSLNLISKEKYTLKVQWSLPGLDCSVGPIISKILVEYCNNKCENRTTGTSEKHLLISNLEGGVAYRARATYITVDERIGQWSDQGVATVKGIDWKIWTIIGGSCLAVPFIIVSILLSRHIRRKLSDRLDIITPVFPAHVDDDSQLLSTWMTSIQKRVDRSGSHRKTTLKFNSSGDSKEATIVTEVSPMVSPLVSPLVRKTEIYSEVPPSTEGASKSLTETNVSNGSEVEEFSDYSKFHIQGCSESEVDVAVLQSNPPKVTHFDLIASEEEHLTDDSSNCPYITAGSDRI